MAKNYKLPLPTDLSPQTKRLQEILDQEGDLQCAIIGVAFLDHCLGSLLQAYLADGSTSASLLQPGSPLGELATRAKTAYSLGLAAATEMEEIIQLGRIRNLFAHRFFDVTFTEPDVVKLCSDLKGGGVIEVFERGGDKKLAPRSRFVLSLLITVNRVLLTALSSEHRTHKGENTITSSKA